MAFIFFYRDNFCKLQWDTILCGRLGWTTIQGTCRLRVEDRSASDILKVLTCLSETAYKATVFTINPNEVRFELN